MGGEVAWPDPHVVRLKELYDRGDSCSQIANELNREFAFGYSRNAVIGKLHRLGIRGGRPKNRGSPRTPRTPSRPRVERKPRVKFVPAAPAVTLLNAVIHLRDVEVTPLHISILELTAENCHYPYGEEQFTFCGHPHLEGFPYCGPHAALTHKG